VEAEDENEEDGPPKMSPHSWRMSILPGNEPPASSYFIILVILFLCSFSLPPVAGILGIFMTVMEKNGWSEGRFNHSEFCYCVFAFHQVSLSSYEVCGILILVNLVQ